MGGEGVALGGLDPVWARNSCGAVVAGEEGLNAEEQLTAANCD